MTGPADASIRQYTCDPGCLNGPCHRKDCRMLGDGHWYRYHATTPIVFKGTSPVVTSHE